MQTNPIEFEAPLQEALKAVLTAKGMDFGRTHNLIAIAGGMGQPQSC